ncbi:MAG: cupin domain-containing protein [Chloroflexota bacterium]|nr:cupin domain-containing protein [Chloroflexota bacterium]
MNQFQIEQMDQMSPIHCPCGLTRRAFTADPDQTATFHLLDVQEDAQVHYHKKITEIYFILEGEGFMELDGELLPVKPYSAVLIKPGCRHRAVGNLRVALTAIPAFDPQDEWFD